MVIVLLALSLLLTSCTPFILLLYILVPLKILKKVFLLLLSFLAGAFTGEIIFHFSNLAMPDIPISPLIFSIWLKGIVLVVTLFIMLIVLTKKVPGLKPPLIINFLALTLRNILYGAALISAYLISPRLGMITTAHIIGLKIPEQLADYTIMIESHVTLFHAIRYYLLTGIGLYIGALSNYYFHYLVLQAEPLITVIVALLFAYLVIYTLRTIIILCTTPALYYKALLLFIMGLILVKII